MHTTVPCVVAVALAQLWMSPAVQAQDVSGLSKRLGEIDVEIAKLRRGIRRPSPITSRGVNHLQRKLVDAQVMFGVGNYDDAAVMLYDVVEKYRKFVAWDEAVYYLAESLFQKGDHVASRSYFVRLVKEVGPRSKFYGQSLERLIELTLALKDTASAEEWLQALESIPAGQGGASVPYVRGKYYFFAEDYTRAVAEFAKVPQSSRLGFQAQYFAGAAYVANKDLAPALKEFTALIRRQPRTDDDRTIVQLAHMAIARLHYERDQPSKAIDAYLRVDRRSELFDEALYEAAWVYVKSKQYDQALRALELLSLADPDSSERPEVRLLEANLRIRRARSLADQGEGTSSAEYDHARGTFEATRAQFRQPHDELVRIQKESTDPREFLTQITGRESESFKTQSSLPPVAAQWLREEPEVHRVVEVDNDLVQIRGEIEQAERTIERLEAAVRSDARFGIFPSLAESHGRSNELLDELVQIRLSLSEALQTYINKYASGGQKSQLARLRSQRQQVAQQLANVPDSGEAFRDRVRKAKARYDDIDNRAGEISMAIGATEATVVAIERYLASGAATNLKATDRAEIEKEVVEVRKSVDEMRGELEQIRRDILVGRDGAGTSDPVAARAKQLRTRLRAILSEEQSARAGLVAQIGGSDGAQARRLSQLIDAADQQSSKLDEAQAQIDTIVASALVDVESALAEERASLASYKREYLNYEEESRGVGGDVLRVSFDDVVRKFYDILVRSDLGMVDVAWSLREASNEYARRLVIDQARERKTLDSDFADIIHEIKEQKDKELRERGERAKESK